MSSMIAPVAWGYWTQVQRQTQAYQSGTDAWVTTSTTVDSCSYTASPAQVELSLGSWSAWTYASSVSRYRTRTRRLGYIEFSLSGSSSASSVLTLPFADAGYGASCTVTVSRATSARSSSVVSSFSTTGQASAATAAGLSSAFDVTAQVSAMLAGNNYGHVIESSATRYITASAITLDTDAAGSAGGVAMQVIVGGAVKSVSDVKVVVGSAAKTIESVKVMKSGTWRDLV